MADQKSEGIIIGDSYYTIVDWHADPNDWSNRSGTDWGNGRARAQDLGGDLAVFNDREEESAVLSAVLCLVPV